MWCLQPKLDKTIIRKKSRHCIMYCSKTRLQNTRLYAEYGDVHWLKQILIMSVAVGGKNRDTGCPQTCAKALKQPPKTCRTKQNKPTWDEGYVLSTFIFNDTESKYSKRCRRCHVTTASSVQTFVLSAFKPSSPNLKCEKMKADTLSVWMIKVSSHNDFRGSEFLFWSVTARHESRGSA